MTRSFALLLLVGALHWASNRAQAAIAEREPAAARVSQIIIQWRNVSTTSGHRKLRAVEQKAGVQLRRKSSIAATMDVLELEHPLPRGEVDALLRRLTADAEIEFAVIDERRYAHATPSDPLIAEQWYLLSAQPAATRAEAAWDLTKGAASTVVAVLDSGVRFEHPDLGRAEAGGKLLRGFDFVSHPAVANDGDGRDPDAADPGDWITEAEARQPPFDAANCLDPGEAQRPSSWHGTRVASLIGALTNNAQGVAGGGWDTLVLPVRVLGKCGGSDSDIIAAMRWAAGLDTPGAPINSTPAKIINLSLGSTGACSLAYRSAIAEITARGALVVASVGNEGGPVGAPANCPSVLGVTGLRHIGTKVGFSNLGPEAALGAPGGNCVNTAPGAPCQFSIVVATNNGATTPADSTYTNQTNYNVGTSFAAPLVASAAALMHSVNPQLPPAAFLAVLRETASPFASSSTTTNSICRVPAGAGDIQNQECICTVQTCGAGMLNAHAAVVASQGLFAVIQAPQTVSTETPVELDASASFAASGRTVASYQWSALDVVGAAPVIADASQPVTTLQVSGPTRFTLRLAVMDDAGAQDVRDMAVATVSAPQPQPPAPAPSSGGGGGALPLWLIAALLALAGKQAYCGGSSFCARSRRYS